MAPASARSERGTPLAAQRTPGLAEMSLHGDYSVQRWAEEEAKRLAGEATPPREGLIPAAYGAGSAPRSAGAASLLGEGLSAAKTPLVMQDNPLAAL